MNTTNRLLVSVFGGEIITLLTGLFSSTPQMLVGAEWFGFPLAWLIRMVVGPEYTNPWRIEFLSFLADVVVWSVILLVVVFIVEKVKKPASK
jgi:hypothetical protein